MDDSELDRLFGEDSFSDDDGLDAEVAPEKETADETPADKEPSSESDGEGEFTFDSESEPEAVTDDISEEKSEEPEEVSEEAKETEADKEESHVPAKEAPRKKAPAVRRERPDSARGAARSRSSGTKLSDVIPLSGKSMLAIGLALALVIMVILVMFLPAFRVRNAHIEGNVVISDQEILKEVGLEYDAHLMSGISGNIFDILRLNYGKTEKRIMKENPYIEDIRITITLPSTVDIRVRERRKICYIRTPDGYAALDGNGTVLELSSFDAKKQVRPVICGLNVKYAELGKTVKITNMNDYKKAIVVLGAILSADNASVGDDYSMFENTSEVRVLPSGYIFLTIYSPSGNLMQIKLNSLDNISDDMAWLLHLFNSDAVDKITVDGVLDMTGDEYAFREYN